MTEQRNQNYELTLVRQPEGRGRYVVGGGHHGFEVQKQDSNIPAHIRLHLIDEGLSKAREHYEEKRELPGRIISRYSNRTVDVRFA